MAGPLKRRKVIAAVQTFNDVRNIKPFFDHLIKRMHDSAAGYEMVGGALTDGAVFGADNNVTVYDWAPEFGGRKWVLRVRDSPSQSGAFGFD